MAAARLTPEQETLWTVALVAGVVVLLVVVALMAFLLLLLRDIHLGVLAVSAMADRLRADTTPADLPATAGTIRELDDELRRHDEELSRPAAGEDGSSGHG